MNRVRRRLRYADIKAADPTACLLFADIYSDPKNRRHWARLIRYLSELPPPPDEEEEKA